MIHKLIKIQGVGKFENYSPSKYGWNGEFKKTNAIYAGNGSGKTTFTQILKSLSLDNGKAQLSKRETFGYSGDQIVEFIDDSKKVINFKNNSLKSNGINIDVFDAFFTEDNVYVFSLNSSSVHVLLGDDIGDKCNEISILRGKISGESLKIKHCKERLNNPNITVEEIEKTQQIIRKSEQSRKDHIRKKRELEQIVREQSEKSSLISNVNNNLMLFCPGLRLTELNRKSGGLFVYGIQINGHDVRTSKKNRSLRHTLSEGEKNALALSLFFARLDMTRDLSKTIVVFDDPITSMDAHRRRTTLNKLTKVAQKAKQFFILSHDMNFIRDFMSENQDSLSLKISNDGETSYFELFDVVEATLTGISKDMLVINDYINHFESSKYSNRDVVRCIRPVLEGFFRIKFLGSISKKEWLGDIIKKIREAKVGEDFYYPDEVYEELSEINSYSSVYHHSNPDCLEVPLNNYELKNYCERTLRLIRKL